jgi:hypothetical protein
MNPIYTQMRNLAPFDLDFAIQNGLYLVNYNDWQKTFFTNLFYIHWSIFQAVVLKNRSWLQPLFFDFKYLRQVFGPKIRL